ncbi:MAG TPA: hypothetical protein EYH01_01275 [Campylobacterales bacterium]|nr:hypothetical protein [Campylobacterales bacterium]
MKQKLKKQFKNKIDFAKNYNFKGIIVSADTNDAIPMDTIPNDLELKEIAKSNYIKTLLLIDFVADCDTLYQSKEYS